MQDYGPASCLMGWLVFLVYAMGNLKHRFFNFIDMPVDLMYIFEIIIDIINLV